MNSGVIRKIYREKDLKKIQEKIDLLGNSQKNKLTALKFINIRLISTILITLFFIFFTNVQYFVIPFITILYYTLFYYIFITNKINERIKKLDKEALDYFEILALTLESGKNLENSLEITCANVDNELSDEFKKSLMEVKFGKSLMEALNDLKKRIPSETINNIILNITQTSVFGNSIISTINNQLDYLREKQVLEIKAQINKIPNKVSIISVVFIVPLILLIILGPFLLSLIG